MRFQDILTEAGINLRMRSKDKSEAIKELAELAARTRPGLSMKEIHRVIWEREQLASTGLEEEIAIPHGRSPLFPSLFGCLGISKEGIDFEAMDGKKTRVFFVLLSPEGAVQDHLQAVAKVTALLVDPQIRSALCAAQFPREIYRLFLKTEQRKPDSP